MGPENKINFPSSCHPKANSKPFSAPVPPPLPPYCYIGCGWLFNCTIPLKIKWKIQSGFSLCYASPDKPLHRQERGPHWHMS